MMKISGRPTIYTYKYNNAHDVEIVVVNVVAAFECAFLHFFECAALCHFG